MSPPSAFRGRPGRRFTDSEQPAPVGVSPLPTFDNITGWFTDRAGVKDSALLEPIHQTTYVFVNHVRLPTTPIRFMLQFAKPSFRKYVAANLHTNEIGNALVICRTV